MSYKSISIECIAERNSIYCNINIAVNDVINNDTHLAGDEARLAELGGSVKH